MLRYRNLGLTILSLLSVGIVSAQSPQSYKFELLDVNQGLSHGQVNSILKDSHGYLWFGTSSGLNLYNGYSIQTFTYDPRDTASVSATDILDLFEGPEGNLWISTTNGLNIYDHATQSFSQDLSAYFDAYDLPNANVEYIMQAPDNSFWFLSTGAGLTRYNPVDQSSVHFTQSSVKHRISSGDVAAIQPAPEGNIWVVHRNGLIEEIDPNSLSVVKVYNGLNQIFGQIQQNYELAVDGDSDLWIYMPHTSEGVFFLDTSEQRMVNFRTSSTKTKLNTNLVRGVVEASPGVIWIGTDHGGINVIDKETGEVNYIRNQPEVENSLVHNSVYYLYKDNEDIIWVGTYKNGVNFYHKSLKRFEHYRRVSVDAESLPFDDVNRFLEDEKGNLWIGTNGGGLLYFDRQNNKYKQYLSDPEDPNSLSSNVIVSLAMSKDSELLVGTYFGGLNVFDGQKFRHYIHDENEPGSISANNIWELYKDSRDDIWISTLSGGLDRWDQASDQITHFPANTSASDSTLNISFVYAIEEDTSGNIWVAGGGGIDIIDQQTGTINADKPIALNVLSENTITSLHYDRFGRMWIGSQEGLYVYNKGQMRVFTEADGLPHNTIVTIVEDQHHHLWLGTPNGISNLVLATDSDEPQGRFVNYDESDGLQGKVFNENAALGLSSGEIVFGGANGFNIFRPDNLIPNLTVPDIVFTDFQLFNKSLSVGEMYKGRAILPFEINSIDELVLRHNENVFSIEFAALNFIHPTKSEYLYKLEGFDSEWRMADQTRRITYTNLDAGSYSLKVKASNNDGIWNDEGISLNIVVKPPFYATNLAYVIYAVLTILALYITRRLILARERAKYKLEQERREARQMHELDLLKIRFLTNISHEFRTPLSLIIAPLDRLISTYGSADQKQFLMMKRNAKRLLNLVNQLLDFRKLEVDTIELNKSDGNIIKFIHESVHSFADLSENKRISLSFKADREDLFVSFDMDKLEKILFNLLSNAFKFTPENGRVDVSVTCMDMAESPEPQKLVSIVVRDNGIGIPEEKQRNVFERFFRNDTPGSVVNQGSGIGLSITREFVQIHGGTIELESAPEQGSCFTVRIPLRELHAPAYPEPLERLEQLERDFELIPDEEQKPVGKNGFPLVLLVEDNDDFRFYLKENIGIHYQVVGARHGKEGWQKSLSLLPDLIVSDLMMPEMNGVEFCKKVKEDQRTSHIPFIMLTADTQDDSKLQGLNNGADDYVTKPFNFEILLSRINNLISQHKSLQEAYSRKISIETSEIEITSLNDKLIQEAVRLVEENISNPSFNVELMSRELGLSRAHLYKKMVALTGMTPLEFIRKIRLQRAAQFLKKSQLTVAEVAYKVGFNNRKYFTKYFKQEYNMLPSAFAASQDT